MHRSDSSTQYMYHSEVVLNTLDLCLLLPPSLLLSSSSPSSFLSPLLPPSFHLSIAHKHPSTLHPSGDQVEESDGTRASGHCQGREVGRNRSQGKVEFRGENSLGVWAELYDVHPPGYISAY